MPNTLTYRCTDVSDGETEQAFRFVPDAIPADDLAPGPSPTGGVPPLVLIRAKPTDGQGKPAAAVPFVVGARYELTFVGPVDESKLPAAARPRSVEADHGATANDAEANP